MIEVKHLSKQYANHLALDDLSFSVAENEILGIVGKSGSGKSTLLKLINLMETPTSGQIVIDGKSTDQLSSKQMAQYKAKIGMVFQHYNLLANKTVAQNIALPLRLVGKKELDRVATLLSFVGMEEKADAYPADLSGGEQQRVAIARALVRQPEILLCDEATSSLDEENTAAILRLLKDSHDRFGITIFFVSHDLTTVKQLCERVLVLEAGHLLGTVDNQPQLATEATMSYLEKVQRRLAR